jgi:hypothetical protein
MKQADINRLKRAAEHLDAALVHLDKVFNNTEGWQRYRTQQHAKAIQDEAVTLRYFANLMQQDPNFKHKDWNG